MTYQTINRAIDAARNSSDPLVRNTGLLLHSTKVHLVDLVGQIEEGWRKEAMTLAFAERHYRKIEARRGPVTPLKLPRGVSQLAVSPMVHAVETARALLTRLGEDQGGEVWPGQYAAVEGVGKAKVVDLSLNGKTYTVLPVGYGTYPTDPTVDVAADKVTPA